MKNGIASWFSAIWGTQAAEVFAVGGGGTILHYSDPSSFTTTTTAIDVTTTIGNETTSIIGSHTTTTSVGPNSTSTAPAQITTTAGPVTSSTSIPSLCPAEVLYGQDSEETSLLRSIRDDILSKTSEGQQLIELYYQWSPVMIGLMEHNEEFKNEIATIMDRILVLICSEIE